MVKLFIILILVQRHETVSNFMHIFTKYDITNEQESELPELLNFITNKYLISCTPYVLYDNLFFETIVYRDALFRSLEILKKIATIQGFIDKLDLVQLYNGTGRQSCFNFLIFTGDVELSLSKLDFQLKSRIVLVTIMSRWQLTEFLESEAVRNIQNLLVISDPVLQREIFSSKAKRSKDINLYTHQLHVDGIGSSALKLLTAWRNLSLTRPEVNLFPPKLDRGLNGHRLIVSAFEQPPYVIRRKRAIIYSDSADAWDGVEIRLLRLIAESLNITLSIRNTLADNETTATDEVITTVMKGKADIGITGIYVSRRYYEKIYFSVSHSQDCATFITLSSTAIPKYRAILGPFQWSVWICVIIIYLLAVIPIAFSLKLSWPLFDSWAEVGNMFWTVFGIFTNLFSFKGERSWNDVKTNSTRLIIGTYWAFTIIITAAYSSSIISFITIPNYFEVVDSVYDLMKEEYRVGVVDSRNWSTMFNDTIDYKTNKLMKRIEILNSTLLGLEKVRTIEKFALMSSRDYLTYVVKSNFTYSSAKKSMFHIFSSCLAPLMVSFAMKPKTDFLVKFDQQIQRFHENGLISKIIADLDWEIVRTGKGRIFSGSSGGLRPEVTEDRQLTVDDMQGMFLLLGLGICLAVAALFRECWIGYECCKEIKMKTSRHPSVPSIVLTKCDNNFDDDMNRVSVSSRLSLVCSRAVSATFVFGGNSYRKIHNSLRRFSQ